MDPKEKEILSNMLKDSEFKDNSDEIKRNKHSTKIQQDIHTYLSLKRTYSRLQQNNSKLFKQKIINQCNFLYTNYKNIFNKLVNNELDINILNKFIYFLKQIEDGNMDQNTASYEIGKLLKSHYIDKEINNNDINNDNINNISWKQFKEQHKK